MILALTLENTPYRALENWLVIGDQGVVHLTSTQVSTFNQTNCILHSASQGSTSCTGTREVVSLHTPKQMEWDLVSLVLNTARLYLHLIFCLFFFFVFKFHSGVWKISKHSQWIFTVHPLHPKTNMVLGCTSFSLDFICHRDQSS